MPRGVRDAEDQTGWMRASLAWRPREGKKDQNENWTLGMHACVPKGRARKLLEPLRRGERVQMQGESRGGSGNHPRKTIEVLGKKDQHFPVPAPGRGLVPGLGPCDASSDTAASDLPGRGVPQGPVSITHARAGPARAGQEGRDGTAAG